MKKKEGMLRVAYGMVKRGGRKKKLEKRVVVLR